MLDSCSASSALGRCRILRWLIIPVLLAAIPAAPHAQALLGGSPAADTPSATDTAVSPVQVPDLIFERHDAQQFPVLTPEQAGDLDYFHQHYQAAIEDYKRVKQPSAAVWNKMGVAYQVLYDLKDASRCYKQALRIDARNADVMNNLGSLQDLMMNFAAAEVSYRKALAIKPESATILRNLGTNLLMQHDYKQGAEAYRQAIALDPHIFDMGQGPTSRHPASGKERGTTAYFKARSCARAGLDDCALNYLNKAFADGSATIEKVGKESDFARLRTTDGYASLIALEQ